jgi:hypothetical protein
VVLLTAGRKQKTSGGRSRLQLPGKRAALVVGHPGHELCVHGWLEQARPTVFVLTDGSGHRGLARLEGTARLLASAGARRGSVFGRLSDSAVYAALLEGRESVFVELAVDLASAFTREGIDYVVADAAEGYSPTHDLCRVIVDTSVALAREQSGRYLASYEFAVVGPPASGATPGRLALRYMLDEAAVERKRMAAEAYPEMAIDVNRVLQIWGAKAFEIECLRPVEGSNPAEQARDVPQYEQLGAQRVAHGQYDAVVRYRDHVLPVARALAARRTR